jgi:hypothetical protein
LLQCGKIMALGTYDVRMKCIDAKITPQNRIILCRPLVNDYGNDHDSYHLNGTRVHDAHRKSMIDAAHAKLEQAYKKAHSTPSLRRNGATNKSHHKSHHHRPPWHVGDNNNNIKSQQSSSSSFAAITLITTTTAAIVGFVTGVVVVTAWNKHKI